MPGAVGWAAAILLSRGCVIIGLPVRWARILDVTQAVPEPWPSVCFQDELLHFQDTCTRDLAPTVRSENSIWLSRQPPVSQGFQPRSSFFTIRDLCQV